MRILLIGEYSNVHWTLAEGLRQIGHEVTVASNGDFWKSYPRDLDFSRTPGKWGGIRLIIKLCAHLRKFRGYDIVQLINPIFFELRAERLFCLYHYLRRHNKKVILGAFGMDWYWVHTCMHEMPFRYSDFNIGKRIRTDTPAEKEKRDWLGTSKEKLNKLIAEDCDAIVTGLYEYDVCYRRFFPEKTFFIPMPIKTNVLLDGSLGEKEKKDPGENDMSTAVHTKKNDCRIKLFIGISKGRSQYKGTDIMLKAAEAIVKKYPNRVILQRAEGVPFAEYEQMINGSDAILDQLYSYTPSMNPLMAMAKGVVCIGGGEPANYEIIGETELRPIINVQPCYESVYHELEEIVLHPERLPLLKKQSIEYIRKHHNYIKVARAYEALYNSI